MARAELTAQHTVAVASPPAPLPALSPAAPPGTVPGVTALHTPSLSLCSAQGPGEGSGDTPLRDLPLHLRRPRPLCRPLDRGRAEQLGAALLLRARWELCPGQGGGGVMGTCAARLPHDTPLLGVPIPALSWLPPAKPSDPLLSRVPSGHPTRRCRKARLSSFAGAPARLVSVLVPHVLQRGLRVLFPEL